ncbi:MFS transporter [Bacillus solitudinis]|uniref:MFS transporter n=1 Tax=Bacillus solitudinis TaxID=2014074 RepID=UPI000C24FBD7|nr:MFS transporter [Bacillus solitudinis]
MVNDSRVSKRILILTTIAMAVAFTAWTSLSPLINHYEAMYNLTSTQKSVLVALPVLLGSILRIPIGILTDRFGGRRVFSVLLLVSIIPLVGISFANSYESLLLWALLLGIPGTSFAVSVTFVSKWTVKEKQGTALGINATGNIGTAVAGFLLPTLAVLLSIQTTFLVLIVPLLLMAILIWFFTPDSREPGEKKSLFSALSILKFKNSWILSLFYFVTFGSFVAFGIYLPTLLMDLFDLSAVDAGFRSAGFVVLATLIRPLGGYLGDKIGAGKVLTYVFIVIAFGGFTIGFGMHSMLIMTVACLSVALASGIGNGAVFKFVPQLFPVNTGAVTGVVGAAGGLGGFFPPIFLGMIKDVAGTYMLGFLLLSLLAVVCLFVNRRQFDQPDPVRVRRRQLDLN